jgi:nucleoside phosphorylase
MKKQGGIPRPGQLLDYVMSRRGVAVPPIPDACIITHSRRLLDLAVKRFSHVVVDIGARTPMEVHVLQPEPGPGFAMVAAVPGAPMAAVVLEELSALGIERFLCLGSAGHPVAASSPRLNIADLLLVERALVYEGTSRHYDADVIEAEPDADATEALSRALERRGLRHTRGPVATTDALYRETPAFVREVVERGALGVDMELSALFTVSKFHGKSIAALVWISDIVGVERGWTIGFVEDEIDAVEESLLPVLVDWVGQS